MSQKKRIGYLEGLLKSFIVASLKSSVNFLALWKIDRLSAGHWRCETACRPDSSREIGAAILGTAKQIITDNDRDPHQLHAQHLKRNFHLCQTPAMKSYEIT